ncbi:MAG TPA: hypothetical protein VF199_06840 [Bacillales bacterium]
MGKMKGFLTGAVFGGLAAGSVVLLTNPKSGEEWRREAGTRGRQAKEAFEQIKIDSISLKDDVVTATRQSIPAIKEGAKGIKASIDQWKKDTEPDIRNLQDQIRELNEQIDKLQEENKK